MSRAYRVPYAFHAIVQIADGRAEDELITISEAFARNPVPPFWYQMPLVRSVTGNIERLASCRGWTGPASQIVSSSN
jgi:hypothetical protein